MILEQIDPSLKSLNVYLIFRWRTSQYRFPMVVRYATCYTTTTQHYYRMIPSRRKPQSRVVFHSMLIKMSMTLSFTKTGLNASVQVSRHSLNSCRNPFHPSAFRQWRRLLTCLQNLIISFQKLSKDSNILLRVTFRFLSLYLVYLISVYYSGK